MRKITRLKDYDYTTPGAYSVTICVNNREILFGEVVDGEMHLSQIGEMIQKCWKEIPEHYPGVELDAFIVMPDHFHGIIILTGSPTQSLFDVVHRFKSFTTAKYRAGVHTLGWPPFQGHFWQPNYFDRIIRDKIELHKTRNYIESNPSQWSADKEYPDNLP
jgi:REP element-mobilizing transposase RayT